MNAYKALNDVANHIEQHPERFNFWASKTPKIDGTGCVLAWLNHFTGVSQEVLGLDAVSRRVLGVDSGEFYYRMNKIQLGWLLNGRSCAAALRQYAEVYHAEKPEVVPMGTVAKPSSRRTGIPVVQAFFTTKEPENV